MDFPPVHSLVSQTFSELSSKKDTAPLNAPEKAAQPVTAGSDSSDFGSSSDSGSSPDVGKHLNERA